MGNVKHFPSRFSIRVECNWNFFIQYFFNSRNSTRFENKRTCVFGCAFCQRQIIGRSGGGGVPPAPPRDQIFLNFIKFPGNFNKIVSRRPLTKGWCPSCRFTQKPQLQKWGLKILFTRVHKYRIKMWYSGHALVCRSAWVTTVSRSIPQSRFT